MNREAGDAPGASPERFVWPPRPLDDRPPSHGAGHREPTGPASPAEYPELTAWRPGPRGRWSRAWREAERVWLGFAAAPLPDRALGAGWKPDAPDAYCPRCGTTVGWGEVGGASRDRRAGDCPACRRRVLPWERTVRLGEYEGLLRELIHETKFTAWRRLGTDVGRLLGRSLKHALDRAGVDAGRAVLVPVPTTYLRRMGRGIDHTRVIARGVREITGMPIVAALERSGRPSQVDVPVSRRAANVAGSIRGVPGVNLRGLTVVVIDDVRTTGATLGACCRALRAGAGRGDTGEIPCIWAGVVAVAPGPGRQRRREHEPAPEQGQET